MDLSGLREEYGRGGLDVPDLAADPIEMFQRWLAQAVDAGVHEPNAMVLATATPEGWPSSRMVLLKGVGPDGFVFYTNQDSRKGAELAANPRCALLFPWHPLERQVRVEGTASVVPDAEVEAYFRSRPTRVGRLPRAPGGRGVLAGTAEPDARPAGLPARRRRLGHRATRSLSGGAPGAAPGERSKSRRNAAQFSRANRRRQV